MKSVGLCIWDWNGTIQDDLHHIYECGVQRIFRHFDRPCPSLDTYRNEVASDVMPFYHGNGIPGNVSRTALDNIMAEGFKEKGKPPDVFPDALRTVQALAERGYVQVLASGYASAKLITAVARNDFAPYFARIIGDVRDKPAVFASLLRDFARPGLRLAAVGDTDEDALAAASIFALPLICTRGFHTLERIEAIKSKAPALRVIGNLEEVLTHLP